MTAKLRKKLTAKVDELNLKVQEVMTIAFERFLQENMDEYFRFEERLQEFEQLFIKISDEIHSTHDPYSLKRLENRIAYLDLTFDDLESEITGRPRRRRKGFDLFNFFRQWKQNTESDTQKSEIQDIKEAYDTLGIKENSNLKTVTQAFRRLIKNLHPDTRGGDRSHEPRLRKLIAAYQFIKNMERESQSS